MNQVPLYDLRPLLWLLFMGLTLAALPLAWLWWRHRHAQPVQRLQALTLLTLVLTFDLVLFGAFTRLSDSGLGCPDWPGCYGQASPLSARAEISAAQQAMPSGPVTHGKAWVEMLHRYFAGSVGVLILVLTLATWVQYWRQRHSATGIDAATAWWATLTLAWVCVQAALGALTVTMKLFPAIVTLHLLGGVLLLCLLAAQAARYAQLARLEGPRLLSPGLRAMLMVGLALLAVQIALGGWVSTNYAVLACNSFPMCQGAWWPQMDFVQGFELWRPLGLTAAGEHLSFAALTAMHYTHRLAAYGLTLLLGLLAWRLSRLKNWQRLAHVLAALLLLQFLTGLGNVLLGWPLLAALLHTGGAAALALLLTWALVDSRTQASRASPAGAAASAST